MGTSIPTLSSKGWVKTIEEKGDFVLSYFITTEQSQSVLYQGKLISLQYLVQRYGNDEVTLQAEVGKALEQLMRGYFGESVDAVVDVAEADPNKPGQLTITFRCIVREDGREHSLGRRVQFLNSKLVDIIKINNG